MNIQETQFGNTVDTVGINDTDREQPRDVVAVELERYFAKEAEIRQKANLKQYSTVPELIPERSKGDAREHAAAALNTNSR